MHAAVPLRLLALFFSLVAAAYCALTSYATEAARRAPLVHRACAHRTRPQAQAAALCININQIDTAARRALRRLRARSLG